MNDPIDTYPLLAVIPGATVEADKFGVVEAQLVLTSWTAPTLSVELHTMLIAEAEKCARWALHCGYLKGNHSWLAASCDSRPDVTFRLELISWDDINAYGHATRH